MKIINILLILCCLTSCSKKNITSYNIGQKSLKYIDNERSRPLDVEVWYPTFDLSIPKSHDEKELFKQIESIPNATIINKKFPLLIISHGTGGNRFSLTWLIEKMVKSGYIVISLGHYGNTTFHKIPREFIKWWERAIDIQFVLDKTLDSQEFKSVIDTEKMGGIGYSLGGYTNIALAGGIVDRTSTDNNKKLKNIELPPEFPEIDEVIDFENDTLIIRSYEKYKDKLKDNRIKAFFVMAPAIGFGFHSYKQTREISSPIFIVAGKGDLNTPIEFNALNYHKLIPTSELKLLGENVGHYVFLNESTEFGKKVAPEITVDKQGVNRKQIHNEVSKLAVTFFNKHLKME